MFYIHQAMHESILRRVATSNTTKKAWDILESSYQILDKVKNYRLHILRRVFECLSMKDTKSVEWFYIRVIRLINQLKYHGENIAEKWIVKKILTKSSLESWILGSNLGRKQRPISVYHDESQSSLINHEHIINLSSTSLEGAFTT